MKCPYVQNKRNNIRSEKNRMRPNVNTKIKRCMRTDFVRHVITHLVALKRRQSANTQTENCTQEIVASRVIFKDIAQRKKSLILVRKYR